MKNFLMMALAVVLFTACNDSGDEAPNRDEIVLYSTYFKSDAYRDFVQVSDGTGFTMKEPTRHKVVRFMESGKLEYFTVDEYNEIIGGVKSAGSYKLDYPKLYDITNVSEDSETTIQNQAGTMVIYLDELKFKASLEDFY